MRVSLWNKANAKRKQSESQCVVCSAVLPGDAEVLYAKPDKPEFEEKKWKATQACTTHGVVEVRDAAIAAQTKLAAEPTVTSRGVPSGAQDSGITLKYLADTIAALKVKEIIPLQNQIKALTDKVTAQAKEIESLKAKTIKPVATRTSPVKPMAAGTTVLCAAHVQSAAVDDGLTRKDAAEWGKSHKVSDDGEACEYVKANGEVCGNSRGAASFNWIQGETAQATGPEEDGPSDDELSEVPALPSPADLIAGI